ncbi:hypothetical protein ACFXJ6_31730 [Streptomyces sp. NPDC059218]|uniref:hypothetical protein n=1 Tax=unclassified Streptomyces TaxID=2593676 RepID=UPI00369E1C35
MATTTVEPKARKRRRKTRTKNVSPLAPLIASRFNATQINLTPGKEHVICPTCKNWTPITGVLGTPVLVPHHTTPYQGRTTPRRCSNSNRRIILDTAVDAWQADLAERTEVSSTVASRRPTRVTRKPRTAVAPAVMRIVGGLVDDKTARRLNEAHIKGCSACTIKDDEGNILGAADIASRCADGRRLAQLAAHTQRVGPARRTAQMEQEEWSARWERGLLLLHQLLWNQHAKAAGDADVQRIGDALTAMTQTLNPHKADAPQLTDWERADLMSAITLLATRQEQLERHRR